MRQRGLLQQLHHVCSSPLLSISFNGVPQPQISYFAQLIYVQCTRTNFMDVDRSPNFTLSVTRIMAAPFLSLTS
ncbi:hypothetical protein ABKN59_004905 [Abortiporus biennis]